MIANLRKFCKFCSIVLVTALVIAIALSPHSLHDLFSTQKSALTGAIQLPQVPEIAAPTPELAWSETGATMLPLAAQIMALRNPQGVPLDVTQKGYLRPLFGDLVDRVTVVYQAQLLDRWSQGGKETHIGGVDSSAQTYCDRIYIRAPYRARDTDRLVLLAHELTHAQQCRQAGGIGQFGERYFIGYYRGGQNYQNNPLEKSARAMEEKFTHQLCNSIGCPPRSGRYYVNYKGWGIKLPVNL
ncbi:hypothetical protein Cha6605_0796 [Chamaesiphon minutus PCC 6605]|uniref:DUF4157 domain-containing protein n=1 Tax=Chamaesiphon minutus (strain ATCC 27169 / PCC 6605) TaxID=1173020 RepID=K9UCX3_CHAP6|nr:hypothetical protein Cha6605_0796 [Chamaesiphon minutus PCC 6605]